jgi:hypothetical protein
MMLLVKCGQHPHPSQCRICRSLQREEKDKRWFTAQAVVLALRRLREDGFLLRHSNNNNSSSSSSNKRRGKYLMA